MSMLIALDPHGIDLAYPAEFERRSDTWGLLFKDHRVKFPSTSQSVRELDGPDDNVLMFVYGVFDLRAVFSYPT